MSMSVTEKIDNVDYTTGYTYNNYGQVKEKQSPSGMRVGYQYFYGMLSVMRNAGNNALRWQATGIKKKATPTVSKLRQLGLSFLKLQNPFYSTFLNE